MKMQTEGFTEVDPFTLLSPHKQCEHIRDTRKDLAGLKKILEIIEASKCFVWDQGMPRIADTSWLPNNPNSCDLPHTAIMTDDWTQREDTKCSGCFGTILSWYFLGNNREPGDSYDFTEGRDVLADYLSIHRDALERILGTCVIKYDPEGDFSPFSGRQWNVYASVVVGELMKQFPDK